MASIDPFDGLPPEIAMEERALKRRQAIAEAMMQRGMAPMPGGDSSGRYFVASSPLSGIAKLVQAYTGRKQLEETDKAYGDLGTKYQKGVTDAILQYQQTKAGTPGQAAIESPPDELGGGPGREATPGTPADPKAAVTAAMLNPYLRKSPMVAADMKALQPTTLGRSMVIPATGEVVATDQTWQQERADAAAAKKVELESKLADAKASREERAAAARELAQMRIDAQREATADRRAMVGAMRQPPAVTPVTVQDPNDPNSTIVIDGRTRAVLGKGPKLTESGKLENKRQFNMQGLGSTIQEAEDILNGVKRTPDGVTRAASKPTGSGIGTVADMAGSLFGMSPAGSVEAQKLKAVSGALVSKMPRMEGPQSDKDVVLYKEMAAQVGDSTVPVDRRIAALDTVKGLWAKYERVPESGTPPAGAPRVVDFNLLPK